MTKANNISSSRPNRSAQPGVKTFPEKASKHGRAMPVSAKVRRKYSLQAWGIVVAFILVIGILIGVILLFLDFGALRQDYYNYFPTPQMRQLRQIQNSLDLPVAAYVTEDDLGCRTNFLFVLPWSHTCERNITLTFRQSDFIQPLRQRLTQEGWTEKEPESFGPSSQENDYHHYRKQAADFYCTDILENHDELDASLPVTVWISADLNSSCSRV